MDKINELLFLNQDLKYKEFHQKLIPNIENDKIIGVRRPILRRIAKSLMKEIDIKEFFIEVPHYYFEENVLHILMISFFNDYDLMIQELDYFIPFIDNWAVCDGFSNKIINKNKDKIIIKIKEWIKDRNIYSKRFAICMLMNYFLDSDFKAYYLNLVGNVKSNDYYLDMVIAWYFATALAKKENETLAYLKNSNLNKNIKKMLMRKAKDSYRVNEAVIQRLEEIFKVGV